MVFNEQFKNKWKKTIRTYGPTFKYRLGEY